MNANRRALPSVLALVFIAAISTAEDKKTASPNERPKPVLKVVPSHGEDKISLDVKDADIRDVLRVFSMITHANIAIDPEVKGSVTVRLDDVRWQDALDVVLLSNGYAAQIEGRIVRVGTPAKLAGEKP